VKYWSEGTLCRFLELPDALNVGAVIFQLVSYLGAFPFPSHAPAILTNDALLRCVTVLTGRWAKVLKSGKGGRGKVLWRREVWRGCAVFDRALSPIANKDKSKDDSAESGDSKSTARGFSVDLAVDADDDDEDDDGLAFEAFEMMDASDAFKLGERSTVQHAMIPSDNFLRLIQLLLLGAPLGPQDSLATYSALLEEDKLSSLRDTAGRMLASFGGVEHTPGVGYKTFEKVLAGTMPFLLDSIQPLFEHFLFSKDFDLHKRKPSASRPAPQPQEVPKARPLLDPLLEKEGDILDLPLLHQLASFLGGNTLYRRLRLLYSGNIHGFSMGQFEKSCFKWQAPSILLVSGTLLSGSSHNSQERAFLDHLPYRRFSSSTAGKKGQRLVYGAYIPVPWKATPKTAFGTADSQLFQLSPIHDVFSASTLDSSYAYFTRPPSSRTGLGFGSPLPSQSATLSHHYPGEAALPLGPVSLHIDDTLTYCSFTHSSQGGGAFHTSCLPQRKNADWQDRFEIEALEVWGCGGTEEAEQQRKAWAW
jgi:hypothetical protein